MVMRKILDEQLLKVKPDDETLNKINEITKVFISELRLKLKKNKISAQVFVGGSLAKNTLLKREKYDVDVFVRFENGGDMKKLNNMMRDSKKIHGSRDYFQKVVEGVIFEVVPVLRIKRPEDAENSTDLSYFHVKYLLNKQKKNKELADEIRLAKVFAHSQNVYGAEGYIRGFSGYGLELLVSHYGSFLKFVKAVSVHKKGKIIIDDSGFYKDKDDVLRNMNKSKLDSPIVLVDPTFKERNSLSSLKYDTFEKFKRICKKFLNNPSKTYFTKKDIEYELNKKYGNKLKILRVSTDKQAGDIGGSKMYKFYTYFTSELSKEFVVKINEFVYDENLNIGNYFFVLNKKNSELIRGPSLKMVEHVKGFKKAHRNTIVRQGYLYIRVKHELSFDSFLRRIKKNKKLLNEMGIKNINVG